MSRQARKVPLLLLLLGTIQIAECRRPTTAMPEYSTAYHKLNTDPPTTTEEPTTTTAEQPANSLSIGVLGFDAATLTAGQFMEIVSIFAGLGIDPEDILGFSPDEDDSSRIIIHFGDGYTPDALDTLSTFFNALSEDDRTLTFGTVTNDTETVFTTQVQTKLNPSEVLCEDVSSVKGGKKGKKSKCSTKKSNSKKKKSKKSKKKKDKGNKLEVASMARKGTTVAAITIIGIVALGTGLAILIVARSRSKYSEIEPCARTGATEKSPLLV